MIISSQFISQVKASGFHEQIAVLYAFFIKHNWWIGADYIPYSSWVLVHWNGTDFKPIQALITATQKPLLAGATSMPNEWQVKSILF